MRRVVGATSREGENEVLPTDEVGADVEQVVSKLLGEHAGLYMRAADMHDVHITFAEKHNRIQLLEEAFHSRAVAWIKEMVAFEMGKRIIVDGFY